MRNVLAPLLSGGCVICCGGLDPLVFWDTLSAHRVTWYHASPSVHHAILMEAANRSARCYDVAALCALTIAIKPPSDTE